MESGIQPIRLIPALLAVVGAAPAVTGQSSDQFASVRAAMQRLVDTVGSPSAAVAVAKDGRIVWEDAMGWANREKRIPATANTIYPLASISKPITATGLMLLVERGRVDLDRPVNAYLGAATLTGFAGDASGATVRRVLSHTAGLPLHSQFFYSDRGYSPPPMVETIRRYGNVVFPPGQAFEYSNLGYGIISYVIERVSGQSYAEFMRKEVFAPLGLTHTSIDLPPGLEDFVAERYDESGHPLPFFTFDHVGASSVYSSAHDLVRFAMFHLKNRLPDQRPILRDATVDQMHQPVPPSSNGLGFGVFGGGNRLAHTGGMPGATTLMVLFPAANVAVVVLANTGTRPSAMAQEFTIAQQAAAAVLPERAPPRLGPPPLPPGPPTLVVTPELAGDWSGTLRTYQPAVPMRLQIKTDGSIRAWIGDQPGAPVTNASFYDGRLSGTFTGRIPTDDAQRWPHNVSLGLLLKGGKLAGEVTANSTAERIYFSLSSYAELRRK
jgi:CubicO group peptidase (beta-lactamase class C family)